MIALKKIDHVHLFVKDRDAAQRWYQQVLGLPVIAELASWSADGGPLTVGNEGVHLALFEGDRPNGNVVALQIAHEQFDQTRTHLESHGLEVRFEDHDMAVSLYFSDSDGNRFEITAYR